MRAVFRFVLVSAWLLAVSVSWSFAATLSLTANQSSFGSGNTLSLSAGIVPTNDAGVSSDIYVAVVSPSGDVLTLDRNFSWSASMAPILTASPIANLQAPNFYSIQLPAALSSGQYTFYLIAVPTGADPLNSSGWLGYASASITFQGGAGAGLLLVTSNATCYVNQQCDARLVASVTGGSTPYHFQQDSFAYGLRPLNTNIDLLTGNLVGNPSQAGTYTFNLCAVDIGGTQDCQPVTVNVVAAPATSTARVFLGGSVALLTRITLDGTVIKDTSSSNLSTYKELTLGDHALSVTCTEIYCFAYMTIEAPSGYTISPTTINLTPTDIPPGATRSFTLTLSRL